VKASDRRRTSWTAAGLWIAVAVWGCQSILGIEDLSLGPRPGADAEEQGGSSGNAGSGGTGAALGGSTNQSGAGGANSSEGGVGGLGLVDSGTDAPTPGGPITVSGRVIDFFRRPVPEAPVTLGEQSVLTNDAGEFTFTDVVPPYDVSLIASTTRDGFGFLNYAYVYQGLTRPDPTLQVYNGLTARSGDLDLTIDTAIFDVDQRAVLYAFSSSDGHSSSLSIDAPLTTGLTQNWDGPDATAGNAHALLVLRSGSSDGDPPLVYESYETAPLAFNDGATSVLTLDMPSESITPVTLTGTVDSGTFGEQTHLISVRFNDGTILPLLEDDSTAPGFAYSVPSLPSTSLIVAASAGSTPYAVAHADGVPAAADQNIALTLPRPVSTSSPGGGSVAGPETIFRWSTLGQTTGVYVWHLESDGFFEGISVITSSSEIQFPRVPGYSMVLSQQPVDPEVLSTFYFYWVVETHGDYASVDAATGPDGFFDSFAYDRTIGTGPSRGSRGYFSESEIQVVNLTAQ
jgi:hypothetical protein